MSESLPSLKPQERKGSSLLKTSFHSLAPAFRLQMLQARAQWEADRKVQRGSVETPHALDQKYPKVVNPWGWFWMFLSLTLSIDPRSGVERRHHF